MTGNHVSVGVLYPASGSAAALFAPYRAGVDARLGVANAAGGVYGRTVSYQWGDDQSEPETNRSAARYLVERGNVFALLEASSVATGSAGYLHGAGVPVVGPSIELAWTKFRNMFSYSNFITAGPPADTWSVFIRDHGGRRAAVLYSPLSETSSVFADAAEQSLKAAGVEVVARIAADPRAPDYRGLAQRIKDSGADTLTGATDPLLFLTTAAYAKEATNLKVVLSSNGYDPGVLRLAGQKLRGLYIPLDYAPFELNLPAHQRFEAAIREYAPQVQPPRSQLALEGWINADMLLRGMEAAGPCLTRNAFMTGLRHVTDYTAGGLLLRPVNLATSFGQPTVCWTFVQLADTGDRWDVLDPKPLCGKVPR